MSECGITHKDIAKALDVSETTIKSYRRKFPGCIPVSSRGKPIRFKPEAEAVCRRIQTLFELGMSIEEVRLRLALEFAWIEAGVSLTEEEDIDSAAITASDVKGRSAVSSGIHAARAVPEPTKAETIVPKVELPPELTSGISGLARSMVTSLQQQEKIARRLQHLEARTDTQLEALAQCCKAYHDDVQLLANAVSRLEGILKRIEISLSQTVKAEDASRVGSLLKVFGIGRQGNAVMNGERSLSTPVLVDQNTEQKESDAHVDEHTSQALHLQNDLHPTQSNASSLAEHSASDSNGDAHQQVFLGTPCCEPPRDMLQLPLVFQSAPGEVRSIAGYAQGRFSISDLKALLSYSFFPPDQYQFQWAQHEDMLLLSLTQPSSADPFAMELHLVPMRTPRGNDVLCIVFYSTNGVEQPIKELQRFIQKTLG